MKIRLSIALILGALVLLALNIPIDTTTAQTPPTNTPRAATATPKAPVLPTASTDVPPAADTPTASGDDIATVLLLGSDTIEHDKPSRTDVIIVAAIDRTSGSVTMLHIPRDMWVYVPGFSSMKINTVMNFGDVKQGVGNGAKLLKDTILYNFGIRVDFFARVDMVWFEKIVQALGGLDITVDCAIQGHRLIDVKGDYNDPKNWELYTLPIGARTLDPYMALWYVRTRYQSSDLDRGRRQTEVLRAMWREAKQKNLFTQVADLWPQAQQYVQTDLGLQDILGFSPLALSLNPNDIHRIDVLEGKHFTQGLSPADGEFIYIPNRAGWKDVAQNLFTPPSKNRLSGENPTVEIGAGITWKGYDQTAADRLAWDGFTTTVLGSTGISNRDATLVVDYTGGSKPNSLKTIVKDLRLSASQVVSKPDPNATVDFHIEMGNDYGRSCLLKLPDLPNTPK
jgi:LCP family protein required for cell wall assembly